MIVIWLLCSGGAGAVRKLANLRAVPALQVRSSASRPVSIDFDCLKAFLARSAIRRSSDICLLLRFRGTRAGGTIPLTTEYALSECAARRWAFSH